MSSMLYHIKVLSRLSINDVGETEYGIWHFSVLVYWIAKIFGCNYEGDG